MKKIVLGSHWSLLPEPWEVYTQSQIDITNPLPFKDNEIDFLSHEHMMEHVEFVQAIGFLKESYRVLKQGGIIRTVMPTVDTIIKNNIKGEIGKTYMSNNINHLVEPENKALKSINLEGISKHEKLFQINALFYRCGHKFIWDTDLLIDVLIAIGFYKAYKCNIGEGRISENCINHRQRGVDMSMDYDKNMAIEQIDCYDPESGIVEGIK